MREKEAGNQGKGSYTPSCFLSLALSHLILTTVFQINFLLLTRLTEYPSEEKLDLFAFLQEK